MAITINFRDITVGPAVNFRQNINYNFSLIKNQLEEVGTQLDTMGDQITQLNTKVEEVDDKITNFRGGIDIKVQATQPTDQKAGDFWFRTL